MQRGDRGFSVPRAGAMQQRPWTRFQIAVLDAEQGELAKARAGLLEALSAFKESATGAAWRGRNDGLGW
jgi:hypothetical protein